VIAKGTEITFTAVGSTGEWIPRTVDDVRQGAITAMSRYVDVTSLGVARDSGGFIGERSLWDYGYTATGRFKTRVDHGGSAELSHIVRDAFLTSSGEIPTVALKGYDKDQAIGPSPGGTDTPNESFKWGLLIILGLVAVTATGVFVAKRG
jgi:hypothetical protein